MLAVELKFLAGRYHATPWGRHVNEADVAWPPDAWRFVRALIATWHRKVDKETYPEELLAALVQQLSSSLPVYRLPPAVHAHTRHYMPTRAGKSEKPVLVYDAFASIAPHDTLIMSWSNIKLGDDERQLLDVLLERLGYLGRAESWLEAKQLMQWQGQPNCVPGDQAVDTETGEIREVVRCLVPLTVEEYQSARNAHLSDRDKKNQQKLRGTLPETLLDALRLETADLQKSGWSQPPAARVVNYVRDQDSLMPQRIRKEKKVTGLCTTARFLLTGKPLPRIEDAVKVGEWMRAAVMSRAKTIFGDNEIPAYLSGHGLSNGNRHEHAFFLPEDADGDGHIDHLWVHVPAGLCSKSQQALGKLSRLYNRKGNDWQLILEIAAKRAVFDTGDTLASNSQEWISATPYLHPWYAKKKLTVEDQLRRECALRGLPELLSLESVPEITVQGRERRPVHFHRFRHKRGLAQPDTHGSFWRLVFDQPVGGPLALGFGCHFGLGLFKPDRG